MTQTPNQEAILNALRTVQDPDLKRDLVSLDMIRDVSVSSEGVVSVRVVLTTPACPLKAKIESDVREALLKVPGVKSANVQMDAQVRGAVRGTGRGAAQAGAGSGVGEIPGVAHIIAVSSGKGGVGKSTVAVNLATALRMEGARVGLMDADVYGPNVPTMMGVTEQPQILNGPQGEYFVPPSAHGIKVMSMGFLVQGDQPMVWRGPMLHSVVSQFCFKVRWAEEGSQLDYLIVDMPPGTGDIQLSLAQLVPVTGSVLVTTPQEVSAQDVRKAFHMFEKVRVPVLGIVENMSYYVCDGCDKRHHLFGADGGEKLSKKFGTPLLAQLPLVPQVREAGDEGVPIVVRNPQSEQAQRFRELARAVAQKVSMLEAQAAQVGPLVQIGKFN